MSAAVDSPEPRRMWLRADDYGISAAVNTAIRDLVVCGRLNAASVRSADMTNEGKFDEPLPLIGKPSDSH